MELSREQTAQIIQSLSAHDEQFRALFVTQEHEEWVDGESEPRDTDFSAFRQLGVDFGNLVLDAVGVRVVRVTDFYYLSQGAKLSQGGSQVELPMAALKVAQSVFEYDFITSKWSERPWLANLSDGRRSLLQEPLLQLPYTRKYCVERAERAMKAENRLWESLLRAYDLIQLVTWRVQNKQLDRDNPVFEWPPLDDIQEELKSDNLILGLDSLADMLGNVRVELLLWDSLKEKAEVEIAEGSYTGPFSGQRRPSLGGGTVKKMLLDALKGLSGEVDALIYPLSEDEREEIGHKRKQLLNS